MKRTYNYTIVRENSAYITVSEKNSTYTNQNYGTSGIYFTHNRLTVFLDISDQQLLGLENVDPSKIV